MCRCSIAGVSLRREGPQKSGQMDVPWPWDMNIHGAVTWTGGSPLAGPPMVSCPRLPHTLG